MGQPRSALTELFARVMLASALVGVSVLTAVDRGATRMYQTPWAVLLWLLQVAPLVAMAVRAALPTERPVQLPPWRWLLALAGLTAALELSAVCSPYRDLSIRFTILPIAAISIGFLVYDWLANDLQRNSAQLLRMAGYLAGLFVLVSLLRWIVQDLRPSFGTTTLTGLLRIQNSNPLGHTSYTAGLALLALPWPTLLALREKGRARFAWSTMGVLALVMLLSSGSRGGVIGLAAFLFTALWLARWTWQKKALTGLVIVLIVSVGAYVHPRTRALLFENKPDDAAPNLSNVQRSAMADGGWLMGRDRPLLGWGVGTTPLAYPKFRSQLDGGVEDALQLHSTPVQLWADLGVAGVVCISALTALTIAAAKRGRRELAPGQSRDAYYAAVLALAGYGAFSLTDYQLDVPVFAFGLAVSVACVAAVGTAKSQLASERTRGEGTPPTSGELSRRTRYMVGACALSPLVLWVTLGKTDAAPERNVRALQLASDPSQSEKAIALLQESLRHNPDQEIAHFNLGWLLVVRDPRQAEQHFLAAAHLVPDKGGVYFGLALAQINQGEPGEAEKATQALALECLNDPTFLVSPWWSNPALQPLRAGALKRLQQMARAIAISAQSRHMLYVEREAEYVSALVDWLEGKRAAVEMAAVANTEERRTFFQRGEPRPDFAKAKVRKYRHERIGYPVLMRDLDLPAPVDIFDVQENDLADGEYRFLFPAKGWVPSPVLVKLLQAE